MKAITSTILLQLLLTIQVNAQISGSVDGKIIDQQSQKPLEYVAVTIVNNADTSKRLGAITNESGYFIIKGLTAGTYSLKASFLGFQTSKKTFIISGNNQTINLADIPLKPDQIALKEIQIKGEQVPVKVKKDTLEFNATAYQTQPNASTEELLKKLPGVQVDKDGNITVQGQKVSRLTVDGKDFFGTDPKTATKNLPADAISKVQVIDSKTQEAKATGIDDGQREKVLNLTIKEDKKKGWFGNANIYGGTTDRYNGYLSANHFKKELQFAVLGMSNNVSNSSFNFDDLNSFSGGNIGNIFAPPAGGSFSINVNNGRTTIGGSGVFDNGGKGLVTTHSGGLNYSNAWGKKQNLTLSSSYFTYFSDADAKRIADIQSPDKTDVLRTNENSLNLTSNQAHRVNLRVVFKPDTLTDITFRPNVILNSVQSNSTTAFISNFDEAGKSNDGRQAYVQDNFTPALFGELAVLRRLGSNKGSVSIRANGTYNEFKSDWTNRSILNEYSQGSTTVNDINQQAELNNLSKSYTLNANFTRPVFNKNWNSSLSYNYNDNTSSASQLTLNFNPATGRYEVISADMSNALKYTSFSNALRAGLLYNKGSWSYNLGLSAQESGLSGDIFNSSNISTGNINRDYYNILPSLLVNYKSKTNQTLQINYRSNVYLPSITDLQPVQNNTNLLYQREGNPNLEAAKNHRISLNFNTFNPKTDRFWNGYFLYNISFDDFSSDIRYNNGVQYVTPVNVKNNYYIRTGSFISIPTKAKGLRSFGGINVVYDHRNNFINSQKNQTSRFELGPNGNISYDIENKLNAEFGTYISINRVSNTLEGTPDNNYLNMFTNASVSYEIVKNFRLQSSVNHQGYTGRSSNFNQGFFIWNAGLEQYLMKRKLTLAIKGFDLLKQNQNVQRNVNNNRIEDVQFNDITRYFYLSLNYKISKAGASNGPNNPRNTVN